MKHILVRFGFVFGSAILGSIVMNSCASSGGGVPAPTNRMARLSNVRMDTLNIGYQAFQTHCMECHADRAPVPPVGRPWHPESLGMSLYSSLNSSQRYGIQQYLKAVDKARFKVDTGSLKDATY